MEDKTLLENLLTVQDLMKKRPRRSGLRRKVLHNSRNPMRAANILRDKTDKRKKKARKVAARQRRINNYR